MTAKHMLALSAVALAGGFLTAGNHFYNISLRPKRTKNDDTRPVPVLDSISRQHLSEGRRWLLSQSGYSSIFKPARDGLRLHAYYSEQSSHRWAICVHGYGDSASGMGYLARHYAEHGWNFLLPDLRGHGRSEGAYMAMGWHDRLDILMWIHWLLLRDPEAEIVLHGVSMGAAAVLMVTGESLPPNVKAAVSDCAFTCAEDQFRYVSNHHMQLLLPFSLIVFPLRVVARIRAGYNPRDASALGQVRRSVTPTLFIHGGDDHFVPWQMMDMLYDAAACPKYKLLIPGAGHAAAAPTNPELYWETVDFFLTPYLNGGTLS